MRALKSISRFVPAGLILAVALGSGSHVQGATALPGFENPIPPVLAFVLDTSGSMEECDGGQFDPANDAGVFDPRASTADDGNCSDADRTNGPYELSRIEAVKLAVSRILDYDGNGSIDQVDEKLLPVKLALATFGTEDKDYRMDNIQPVGASFTDIWASVSGLIPDGNTPLGPVLAGVRTRIIQNCYDGDPATPCDLGPGGTNALGDDVAIDKIGNGDCRDYFVLQLTDGNTNTDWMTINQDPILAAKAFAGQAAVTGESVNGTIGSTKLVAPAIKIRTIGVGFGDSGTGVGNDARGLMNCVSYWGSEAGYEVTDANKDRDDDFKTMDVDTDPNTTGTNVGTACDTMGGMNAATKAYGSGWFAKDANELAKAFQEILNSIQAGTYSKSEPTSSSPSTVADVAIFGAYFDVLKGALDYRGHLRKYRFSHDTGDYVDCDNPAVQSNPVVPCWDGAGWYGQPNISKTETGSSYDGLYEREWQTRRIFAVNPTNFDYDPKLTAEHTGRPTSSGIRTVVNIVPMLENVSLPLTDAEAMNQKTGQPNLWALMAYSGLKDADTRLSPNDSNTYFTAAKARDSLEALMFVAGRPTATFDDGTQRCTNTPGCADDEPSPKVGDSYNSRPVLVGPPVGLSTDATFVGEFLNRTLTNPYGNTDAVTEVDGTIANPCGKGFNGPCRVKERRPVVYLAGNDGLVRAYDEPTGHELWAFVPPGHMWRLANQRGTRTAYIDGLPVVRDVKFPCTNDPNSDGYCEESEGNGPFEDGRWHTLLLYNQAQGGNFVFALDVTNPVDPVFLWEYRHPEKMGATYAYPTVAQLPIGPQGPKDGEPGVAVFVPGGLHPLNSGDEHVHLYALQPHNGTTLDSHHLPVKGLADDETLPTAIQNGMTGAPMPVDGNQDGVVDRVYFGDREGRLWKACEIGSDGKFKISLFFDPAMYDDPNGAGVGQPTSDADPTQGTANALDRMSLRGPVFFAPDVTRDALGNLIVAFGAGDMLSPLATPSGHANLLWVLRDDPDNSCSPPLDYSCDNDPANAPFFKYTAPQGSTFTDVILLSDTLTGRPLIFKDLLFYSEFDPDRDDDGNVCENDISSRLVALDVFGCEAPPNGGPFDDGNGGKKFIEDYQDKLITGLTINPKMGTVFTTTTPNGGDTPPQATEVASLRIPPQYLGFRERE